MLDVSGAVLVVGFWAYIIGYYSFVLIYWVIRGIRKFL